TCGWTPPCSAARSSTRAAIDPGQAPARFRRRGDGIVHPHRRSLAFHPLEAPHMNVRRSLIATACLFALAACGGESDTAATDTAAVDTAPAATGDAPATDAGLGADTAAACETTIDGNDAMKFSTDHIAV